MTQRIFCGEFPEGRDGGARVTKGELGPPIIQLPNIIFFISFMQ
jgi:hypothetical protein